MAIQCSGAAHLSQCAASAYNATDGGTAQPAAVGGVGGQSFYAAYEKGEARGPNAYAYRPRCRCGFFCAMWQLLWNNDARHVIYQCCTPSTGMLLTGRVD